MMSYIYIDIILAFGIFGKSIKYLLNKLKRRLYETLKNKFCNICHMLNKFILSASAILNQTYGGVSIEQSKRKLSKPKIASVTNTRKKGLK